MSWARVGTSIALVAVMACAACGSFSADNTGADGGAGDAGDGAAACVAQACGANEPSCSERHFESGCGLDVAFSGNTTMTGVVGECVGGKVHIAAKDTLDITADVSSDTPGQYKEIRVSARIAVTKWDGKSAVTLSLERMPIAEIDVVMAASGRPAFSLCNGGKCAGASFEANVGEEHLFDFVITSTTVSLSVDCVPLATAPAAITFTPDTSVVLSFGHQDASPIDGTIDDIVIAYR